LFLRTSLGIVLALLALGQSRVSRACKPAIDPVTVEKPRFAPADAARIRSESLAVACDGTRCTVTADYEVEASQAAQVSLVGDAARDAQLWIDGHRQQGPTAPIGRGGVAIRVVTRRQLRPTGACFQAGVFARHPWFARGSAEEDHLLELEVDPAAPIRVTASSGWEIDQGLRGETISLASGRPGAFLHLASPPSALIHGGPVVLAGAQSGAGRSFRGRFGWEIAAPPWLVWGAFFDTDFDQTHTAALTMEAVSRAWIVPISMGAGLGPAVRLSPEFGAGVRAQISLALGPGRLSLSLDGVRFGGHDLEVSAGAFLGASL
jgi:hypothetical protein